LLPHRFIQKLHTINQHKVLSDPEPSTDLLTKNKALTNPKRLLFVIFIHQSPNKPNPLKPQASPANFKLTLASYLNLENLNPNCSPNILHFAEYYRSSTFITIEFEE